MALYALLSPKMAYHWDRVLTTGMLYYLNSVSTVRGSLTTPIRLTRLAADVKRLWRRKLSQLLTLTGSAAGPVLGDISALFVGHTGVITLCLTA